MHIEQNRQVISLAERKSLEKGQTADTFCRNGTGPEIRYASDFMETLFGLLGESRKTMKSFVGMKLDRRRRAFYKADLGICRNLNEECRCVKSYMAHLPAKDLNTLRIWIRRLLSEKIDAVSPSGVERRLDNLNRLPGFDRAQADDGLLFLLLA